MAIWTRKRRKKRSSSVRTPIIITSSRERYGMPTGPSGILSKPPPPCEENPIGHTRNHQTLLQNYHIITGIIRKVGIIRFHLTFDGRFRRKIKDNLYNQDNSIIPLVATAITGMSTAFWEQLDYSPSVLSKSFDFSIVDASDSSANLMSQQSQPSVNVTTLILLTA